MSAVLINADYGDGDEYTGWTLVPQVEVIEPAPPRPEIPAEVHNATPVDADRCMRATRSLCGG